jgi:hypothetical protein
MLNDLHHPGGEAVEQCVHQHYVQNDDDCDTTKPAHRALLLLPEFVGAS